MDRNTIFLILLPLVGLVFLLAGIQAIRQSRRDQARLARAIRTRGVVVDLSTDGSNSVTPKVRYHDRESVEHVAESAGNCSSHRQWTVRFHRGQTVNLVYDPQQPSWVWVEDTREATASLAESAVRARLAACAQIVGPITSTYWWAVIHTPITAGNPAYLSWIGEETRAQR